MQVSDYMTASPVTIAMDADYQDAFQIMEERDLHHLPVVDAEGAVIGILTRRDLQLAARCFKEAPAEVSEVMHSPVTTIAPDADLAAAVDCMRGDRIGCLPVSTDGGHQIVGIITETDLLRALAQLLAQR
ncbi:MAG: HPP family protein [Halochromatium sp.]|uniref:CBS domain-containing protein n=1 Tax=Halochromatium sp. TaxID=2049430 RepID=UPI00397C5E4E